MACATCGKASNPVKSYGGSSTSSAKSNSSKPNCKPENLNWCLPVKQLPPYNLASRSHAYLIPSDQLFILNYNGDGWLELTQ